jgi:dolichol-phosphate mannosyltransferase
MTVSHVAVVIPCYKVAGTIREVILGLPGWIEQIIVVDDACPEGSGRIAENLDQPKITVVTHASNQGVGGAMMSGYRKALELGCEIVVKMDGDGQMDPAYLPQLLEPLMNGQADYVKGNRFIDTAELRNMPKIRLFGNNILSFLEKLYSGYWNILDPTNGFTAIHRRVLLKLDLAGLARDYFFESHMLLNLNILHAVVRDIPIPARYGNENSSLRIGKILLCFPPRLLWGLIRRIWLKYYLYDFNMASVYLTIGIPLFLWGSLFGLYEWLDSFLSGQPKTAGTVMVAALPLILSVELLLQAIHIDINSIPRKPGP